MRRKTKNRFQPIDAFRAWLAVRIAAVDAFTRAWLLRIIGSTGLVALTLLIIGYSLRQAETFVHSLARYDRPLILEWRQLPDWLTTADNGHILDALVQRVALHDADRQLDATLAARLGAGLTEPDVGWIKSLEQVRIRPDGVVEVDCRFRRPAAWVKLGRYCYLLDDENVRLPGRYHAEDCQGTRLMTITGVRGKPPGVGQKWAAADLDAGQRLVAILTEKPFAREIVAINVANHDGRMDRNRSHIELVTENNGSRIWWGRSPRQEMGIEISASQKLILLDTLYRQWGRLDMDRPYIDIRTWPDRIAMPMLIPASDPARVLRG
jgi:hypothetical protein